MLFHMLLGFLIMRALLALARLVARLPSPVDRGWARLLNAATKSFDLLNFLGSRLGGSVVPRRVMIEWVESYLRPLDEVLGDRVRFGARVVGVARRGGTGSWMPGVRTSR